MIERITGMGVRKHPRVTRPLRTRVYLNASAQVRDGSWQYAPWEGGALTALARSARCPAGTVAIVLNSVPQTEYERGAV